ncbi:MAG: GNAT family N-acetyltransferase [Chloroflexi bacterium]|nr:GNAT family N-acetyltransferase [Chloroflexota bacterium]
MNNTELQVTCIGEFSEFMNLAGEWNSLADKTIGKSVFLRHEWFDAAWQWRQQSSELSILTVRQNGSIIGICPLVKTSVVRNKLSVRALQFLTVPDTQFCDIIASPEEKPIVLNALAKWLRHAYHDWDTLELSNLRQSSRMCEVMPLMLKKNGISATSSWIEQNPYVDLQSTWADFYKGCSRRLKKGNNLIRNRLQRAGRIRLEQVQDKEDIRVALDISIALSSRSWKQKTNTTFNNAGPHAFIERLTTFATHQNWISVWIFYLDDKPLAAEYQLVYDGDVYALRADFDETAGELSPGSYLNWQVLEHLFDRSLKHYYMGPGKNPYKKRWTKVAEPLGRIVGYNTTLRGRALYIVDQYIRPWKQKCTQLLQNKTIN